MTFVISTLFIFLYCVITINHRCEKVDIGPFKPYLKTFTLNSFTLHTHCVVILSFLKNEVLACLEVKGEATEASESDKDIPA